MKKIYIAVILLFAAVSCTKQFDRDAGSLTIRAGFLQEGQPESKTYVQSSTAGTIWWGTTNADKIVYAFDQSGTKYAFESSSTTSEAVRSFTCNSWSGGDWKFAIWSGSTASNDDCTLSGSVITGNCLRVKNPQTVNNTKSFDNTANIAVMKPTDGAFRNVFGYLRFNLPSYPGTTDLSAIKSVQLTADEDICGKICIDYSGSDPVVNLTGDTSNSLTLNARWKSSGYESGIVFMVLPAGTYNNAKLTITPFSQMPTSQGAATAEPITVNFDGSLIIERGKYADCGTLPYEIQKPVITWPNDPDAFDYGRDTGDTRKASLNSTAFSNYGVSSSARNITEHIVVDGITYCGPGMMYYGNRVLSEKVNDQWTADYPDIIPDSRCFSFKVNRPGTLRFYPAVANVDNGVPRVPTYYLAAVTTIDGVTSAKIIKEFTPTDIADGTLTENRNDSNVYSDAWQKYWVTMTVTEADLTGIESAATLYLYHRNPNVNTLSVNYWPLEWTVSDLNQ